MKLDPDSTLMLLRLMTQRFTRKVTLEVKLIVIIVSLNSVNIKYSVLFHVILKRLLGGQPLEKRKEGRHCLGKWWRGLETTLGEEKGCQANNIFRQPCVHRTPIWLFIQAQEREDRVLKEEVMSLKQEVTSLCHLQDWERCHCLNKSHFTKNKSHVVIAL